MEKIKVGEKIFTVVQSVDDLFALDFAELTVAYSKLSKIMGSSNIVGLQNKKIEDLNDEEKLNLITATFEHTGSVHNIELCAAILTDSENSSFETRLSYLKKNMKRKEEKELVSFFSKNLLKDLLSAESSKELVKTLD